ncbi:hypothetical protein V6N13_061400 [Hibiscus sabdariffa]
MISSGRSNSPTMQSGMAPPHGLQLSSLRSIRNVSMPPFARVSAAAPPAGPPPMTATLRLRLLSLGEVLAADTWNLTKGLEREVVVGLWQGKVALRRSPVKGLKVMELMFRE